MITNNGITHDPYAELPLVPADDTLVLLSRPTSATPMGGLSVFADARWDITPGLFDQQARGSSIPWHGLSDRWSIPTKAYFWQLINSSEVVALATSNVKRLSLRSLVFSAERTQVVLAWFDAMGVSDLKQFDSALQERFLLHILELEVSNRRKQQLVSEVIRLWMNRHLVEAPLRLPEKAPWDGASASSLVPQVTRPRENARHRIEDATLQPLLVWALRFVEDFADDICAAQHAWVAFDRNRPKREAPMERGANGSLRVRVEEMIETFRQIGRPLPGRQVAGRVSLDLRHLANIIGCRTVSLERYQPLLLRSGLPIEPTASSVTAVSGRIDGRRWLPQGIAYRHTTALARHLMAACYIVTCYLSGMRPGEVLNLRRGCATTDQKTLISTIQGTHFKGVRDEDGTGKPEGEVRQDPWVVHGAVVRAVEIMERLHPHDLLFPSTLMPGRMNQPAPDGETRRNQGGRPDVSMNKDISAFTEWVNMYCRKHGRPDTIPVDRHGGVTGSRFRRTLAWHIVREPRGLVAAAIQYGHVQIAITQAYGGGADSGFADELAFEDWLLRSETIADIQASVETGEQVSGPAAAEFFRRVADADRRFAGRVHPTVRTATKALENSSLQVFKGRGMHCVMDAAKAACAVTPLGRSNEMTPDLDGCKPQCQNIARTDEDIDEIRSDAQRLEEVASDPLAPSIRTARERAEAARLRAIIERHERDVA